ncbi:glycosyltransferase family 4 protein [Rothia sp. ZJ932]|uniref:glycosyltransferase family 4 protein n=1 Tax=Rothia sp. ZJ932 TaxID=2810516 RepID=UPI0019672DC2|nr:glycosyltransferase family 4 protein [Rothia sp. ZJ932]QRZ61196.1 glycosyltransferase family 4 protein [Rothia sp. ZJ932]
MNSSELVLATNNGDIGGGEVMLLNIARAARSLKYQVTVVAPSEPAELLEAARDEGFPVIALPAANRKQYMAQLAAWNSRHRGNALLWCNGLVPSLATAGQRNRIVHLHQLPVGAQKYAVMLARHRATATLVPSQHTARKIKSSTVFHNWTNTLSTASKGKPTDPIRVGFLGRPSEIKGTHTLAEALYALNQEETQYRLVIGGSAKFVDETSQQRVQESLDKLGEAVELLGWVGPDSFMRSIDLLVVPSEVDETFGLVAAEAMSASVPLIVSDAGALPEVVGEDYPWIAPQSDPATLAQMISTISQELRDSSPLLEETLKKSLWRWRESFSPEAGKQRVNEVLLQCGKQIQK